MEAAPSSHRDPHTDLARVMPGLVTVLLAGGRSVELSLSAVGLAYLRNLARNGRVGMGSAALRAGAGERLGDGLRCS